MISNKRAAPKQDECEVLTTSEPNSDTTTASCSSNSFFSSSASTTCVVFLFNLILSTDEQPWPPVITEAPNWSHELHDSQKEPSNFRLLHWGPMIAIFIIGFVSILN